MTPRIRELEGHTQGVHGGNRRPEPEFTVDPAEIAAYTARVTAAVEANRQRLTRERIQDGHVKRRSQ